MVGRPEVSSTRPDGQTIFLPEAEFENRRMLSYVGLAFALLVSVIAVHRFEFSGGPELHVVLEAMATVLALVVGALALVRFYSRKRGTYLFLGTGFLATAFLDGYHAVITSPFVATPGDPALPNLTAWSWVASRVFLSLFLFVSWLAWYQERGDQALSPSMKPGQERSVYITASLLTLVIFVFFARATLSDAYFPERLLSRPGEFVPGFFFALALAGFLSKGDWRRDTFEHWLVIALMISVMTHLGFLIFSSEPHDLSSAAGHIFKVLSYSAVLAGLLASVYLTFRREGEASAAILEANAALAVEVKVRGRAERVLQESEERLQDFLDNANDLIHSTDPEGEILYVNEAWKRTFGYTDEEIKGLNIHSLIDPESRDAFRGVIKRLFQGEAISDFEVGFRARNGKRLMCSGSSNCRFEAGHPVATRTILRNVTEERRAEEELARSQANVRALFESTGDAIWSVDSRQELLTFNTAYALTAEVMSGKVPKVGDPSWQVTPAEDLEWFKQCYDRALAGTRFSAVRDDRVAGKARAYELFFNPIEGEDGTDGVVVFSKDITRRRIAEEALRSAKLEAEDANLAKSQFMANMSHELRTPLNSVIGFANILLKNRSGQLEDKELGFLERIMANGKHLLTLINEILDLSKIEAGRMELDLETVELEPLIDETLLQMEGQIGGKPVVLRREELGEPGPLSTDAGKLKQVIINLVGNALKFTEEGEVVVQVEAGESGREPQRIHVRDTGPGIPDDRLDAIFQAFQQADGSTTRRFGGTGLGLTISRSLCELMGYRLTAASEVGVGSTFTIHLMAGDHGPTPKERGSLDHPPRARWAPVGADAGMEFKGKTALVVDDEAVSRTLLEHHLSELGFRVVTAIDGVEAIEMARGERPDLVTVDLLMPRMSGWDLLKAMKQDPQLRDTPAVVVSVLEADNPEELPDSVDFLPKPFERDDLVRVLRENVSRESGRVLVVDQNVDTSVQLQRYLREAGLVVHAADNGESALAFLHRSQVDLVLLDLGVRIDDGSKTLQELRSRPYGLMVPVVVLTAAGFSEEERENLGQWVNDIIIRGPDVEDRLRGVLDEYFAPRAEAAERS